MCDLPRYTVKVPTRFELTSEGERVARSHVDVTLRHFTIQNPVSFAPPPPGDERKKPGAVPPPPASGTYSGEPYDGAYMELPLW